MRLRSTNSRRVRLTAGGYSTANPPREATTMPRSTYFDGVPVRDPHLAVLLAQAEQQGFRIEAAANGGHQRGSGLAVYPPDTSHSPVRFGVVEVHPKHTANVRSQLRASGFTDPDRTIDLTDQATSTPTPEDSTMARTPRKSTAPKPDRTNAAEWVSESGIDHVERAERTGLLMKSLVEKAGAGVEDSGLAGLMVETMTAWFLDPMVQEARQEVRAAVSGEQVDEALALAAAAEARAVAAEARLARADEQRDQARKDCGAALERAKTAEARAEALDAALRPLRAILAPQ